MGSLRSVGRDPLGVMEGIPKGSQERSLGDESELKREERRRQSIPQGFSMEILRECQGATRQSCAI